MSSLHENRARHRVEIGATDLRGDSGTALRRARGDERITKVRARIDGSVSPLVAAERHADTLGVFGARSERRAQGRRCCTGYGSSTRGGVRVREWRAAEAPGRGAGGQGGAIALGGAQVELYRQHDHRDALVLQAALDQKRGLVVERAVPGGVFLEDDLARDDERFRVALHQLGRELLGLARGSSRVVSSALLER